MKMPKTERAWLKRREDQCFDVVIADGTIAKDQWGWTLAGFTFPGAASERAKECGFRIHGMWRGDHSPKANGRPVHISEYCVCEVGLNWSTFVKGTGRTPAEARCACLEEGRKKLKAPSLKRLKAALGEPEQDLAKSHNQQREWKYGDPVYVISWKTGMPKVVRKLVMREDSQYGIELSDDSLHPVYWKPAQIFRTRGEAETKLKEVS